MFFRDFKILKDIDSYDPNRFLHSWSTAAFFRLFFLVLDLPNQIIHKLRLPFVFFSCSRSKAEDASTSSLSRDFTREPRTDSC